MVMADTNVPYRYIKRAPEQDDEARFILRERHADHYVFEMWDGAAWVDGWDFWWQTRQEYYYWDIDEEEAMEEMKKYTKRKQEFDEQKKREDAEAMQQILDQREAERAARNEMNDWTTLETAAFALHEMFTALCQAGFTEDQAISIVAKTMMAPPPKEDEAA